MGYIAASYDDEDFSAVLHCCSCGGGRPSFELDAKLDAGGRYGCARFRGAPEKCFLYDDEDFTASEHCCDCSGGKAVDPAAAAPPAPLCLDTDWPRHDADRLHC